jgi:hypothetical protein
VVGALCAAAVFALAGAADETLAAGQTRVAVVVVNALNKGETRSEQPHTQQAAVKPEGGGSPLKKGYTSGGKLRKAGKSEQKFDPGLENVKSALAELPYDTFRLVKSATMTVELKKESIQEITKSYTLHVTPIEKDGEDRLRVKVWIEQKRANDPDSPSRRAIDTTSALAKGKPLVLGGLTLDGSSLVVVLTVED